MEQSPIEYNTSTSSMPTSSNKPTTDQKHDTGKSMDIKREQILREMIKLMVSNTVNTLNKLAHIQGDLISSIDGLQKEHDSKVIEKLNNMQNTLAEFKNIVD